MIASFWTDPASAGDASTPAGILLAVVVVAAVCWLWSRYDRIPVPEYFTHEEWTGRPQGVQPGGELGPILEVLNEAARYRRVRWNVQQGWAGNSVAVCSDSEPIRSYTWNDSDTESVAAAIWWDWCDPAVVEALS